jgi:hypothetical protein
VTQHPAWVPHPFKDGGAIADRSGNEPPAAQTENQELRTENQTIRFLPLAAALAFTLRLSTPAQAAQMVANLERQTIYFGTQTALVVVVADPTAGDAPVVAAVDGLQIAPSNSSGVVRDLISGAVRYNYRFPINPQRAGDFTIPSVTLGSGADALTQGPFTLHVLEAPLKYLAAQVDPPEIRVGEKATATIAFQGYRPDKTLTLPTIDGLTLRVLCQLPLEMSRPDGLPISRYQVEITAARLGNFALKGIALDNAPADALTLKVLPFVIAQATAGETALVVGGQTRVQLVIRGLPTSAGVSLVAPRGLTVQSLPNPTSGPAGVATFSFNVKATEPGAPTITTLKLADGSQVPLPTPLVFSVRTGGEGDIIAARGTARSQQTVIGEPFIVDYEVFFRGDFQAAGVDLRGAAFAALPYVKVEPVNDVTYKDWTGQPAPITLIALSDQGRMTALLGSGEINGHKEQMLRFALKITPLAVGDVDLKGVRAILRLQITRGQRGSGFYFMGTQDYARAIDLPPHQVVEIPGKTPPPGYRGAVGAAFVYTTALDRTAATAMSPLTLTLKITGETVSTQFKPPALTEIPELTRDFDVSSTTGGGDVQGNTITFTQVVRPRRESVKELPALPLVYYDYLKKDYQTVYSLPIPLTITPGSLVGATDMQTRSGSDSAPQTPRESSAGDPEIVPLGANHTTLGAIHSSEPLNPGIIVAVLLACPCIIFAVWAGSAWHTRRRPVSSIRRQRRELVAALDHVAQRDGFYVALADLLQSYLRLTFDLPPGEVSAAMLTAAMNERQIDDNLRQSIEDLLMRCDVGRFTAAGADKAEKARLVEQARQLFARLDGL